MTKTTRKRKPRRLSQKEWEAIYKEWKAGEKPANLAKKYVCTVDTIVRLIQKGRPENEWPSFKSRLRLEDARVEERMTVSEYDKVRSETLVLLRALRAAITVQVQKMLQRAVDSKNTDDLMKVATIIRAFWLEKATP